MTDSSKNTPGCQLVSLPNELLQNILEDGVLSQLDLANVCLASRALWLIADPLLYREVSITSDSPLSTSSGIGLRIANDRDGSLWRSLRKLDIHLNNFGRSGGNFYRFLASLSKLLPAIGRTQVYILFSGTECAVFKLLAYHPLTAGLYNVRSVTLLCQHRVDNYLHGISPQCAHAAAQVSLLQVPGVFHFFPHLLSSTTIHSCSAGYTTIHTTSAWNASREVFCPLIATVKSPDPNLRALIRQQSRRRDSGQPLLRDGAGSLEYNLGYFYIPPAYGLITSNIKHLSIDGNCIAFNFLRSWIAQALDRFSPALESFEFTCGPLERLFRASHRTSTMEEHEKCICCAFSASTARWNLIELDIKMDKICPRLFIGRSEWAKIDEIKVNMSRAEEIRWCHDFNIARDYAKFITSFGNDRSTSTSSWRGSRERQVGVWNVSADGVCLEGSRLLAGLSGWNAVKAAAICAGHDIDVTIHFEDEVQCNIRAVERSVFASRALKAIQALQIAG